MAVITKRKITVSPKVTGTLNALVRGRGGKVGLKRKMNPTVVAPPPKTAANTVPTMSTMPVVKPSSQPLASLPVTDHKVGGFMGLRAQSVGIHKGSPTPTGMTGVTPPKPPWQGELKRFGSVATGNANALTRGRGKKKGLTKRQQMIGDKARRAFGKRKSKPKT